ncbi:MAG: cytochrome b/b6 domain-containing protein [Proteobacteria bacterium]|nr:cytochrome b/b6 domain-containing protein [Pseudomonadota bacterium]
MTDTRYDTLTRSLHWLIALLVVASYGIGLFREVMPKGDARTAMLALHMSLGLSLLLLMVPRLLNRMVATPLPPVPMAPPMALAAKLTHIGLYLLLLLLPVVGLLAAWIKGRTVGLFGLPLPSPFAVNRDLAHTLEEAHEVLGHAMMALAGLHAAAAIYHHKVLKDGVLARMLPSRPAA